MARIGFIGLGNMGAPMAANLIKAGHAVTAFDLSADAVAKAAAGGAKAAGSAAEAASGQEIVVTMLPNGAILGKVMAEIAPAAEKGALLIDCSTVDVAAARAAHETAVANGLLSLDAPVSGGVGGAEAATLTFMAGGADEAFAKAQPILEKMGAKIVHCGGAGAGQAAKICNNMILGISMLGVCEAFALADSLGLDRQAMYDVASTASGQCWSLTTYCPAPGVGPTSPSDNDYKAGFAAALMLKDLKLSQEAAGASGATTPMGAAATANYEKMVAEMGGEIDFSGALPWLERMKGAK